MVPTERSGLTVVYPLTGPGVHLTGLEETSSSSASFWELSVLGEDFRD